MTILTKIIIIIITIYYYKIIFVSKYTTSKLVDEFKSIYINKQLLLPPGNYSSHYENADTFNLWQYILVQLIWNGGYIDSNQIWHTKTRFINNSESGDNIIGNSIIDNKPCNIINFNDNAGSAGKRYYEIRQRSSGEYLSIVRRYESDIRQKSDKILDIHILKQVL